MTFGPMRRRDPKTATLFQLEKVVRPQKRNPIPRCLRTGVGIILPYSFTKIKSERVCYPLRGLCRRSAATLIWKAFLANSFRLESRCDRQRNCDFRSQGAG